MAHARSNAQYEVNVWLPTVLGKYNKSCSGSRRQIMLRHKGQQSPRQFPGRYWEDGTHIRADVAGHDWTAEIGVTSAMCRFTIGISILTGAVSTPPAARM